MFISIKEWPDSSATIILNNETVLWTFNNIKEAARACNEWYDIHNIYLIANNVTSDN